jgi:hypothetical protein
MHKLLATTFAIATLGIVIGCYPATPAEAQYQSQLSGRCPAGYWLLEPVCINQDTGDVVSATPSRVTPVVFDRGCAPGYWRLADLCLSPATGDVELADEKRWPAGQRTAVRN